MSFYWPWFLLLLPVAVFWPFMRRRFHLPIPTVSLKRVGGDKRLQWSFVSPLLLAFVGLCMVVALARPQDPREASWNERSGIDIVIAMDTSGSMGVSDYQIGGKTMTRMAASKTILKRFVDRRRDDRVGVTVFGEEAFAQAPLSIDHDGLSAFIDQIDIGLAGDGATAIGEGMAIAAQQLKDLAAKEKILILLTDGENNYGINPLMVAKACAEFDIRVYPILLSGAASGFADEVELGDLKTIAEMTGGQAFRAQTAATLQRIYSDINDMEPTTAKTISWDLAEEYFDVWLLLAIILAVIHLLLSETWLRRLT